MPITVKSHSQLIEQAIALLRITLPQLDTKIGTVGRDLFLDPPLDQLAQFYSALLRVSRMQSLDTATGVDLDNLAANFEVTRKQATRSTGTVLMTLSSMSSSTNVEITNGTELATGGENIVRFRVVGNYTVSGASRRTYQAVALTYRDELDYAGISDAYAIEVSIEAVETGADGNIAAYMVTSSSVDGITNVINVDATSGGTDSESDASLRTRLALAFTGNSIGTTDGLRSRALSVTEAQDALVVGPGDILMLRDGTEVTNGAITALGSGGMVDVWVLGEVATSSSEIFTYQGLGDDATDQRNDVVLGRYNLQYQQVLRQLQETVPLQPIIELTSVTGVYTAYGETETTIYTIDTEVELLKDIEQTVMSGYESSPYGADKLHFKAKVKTVEDEEITRGTKDGEDSLDHQDVNSGTVYPRQRVSIINDTAIYVDANTVRTRLAPIYSVSRVYNYTTGEEYDVEEFTSAGYITLGDLVTIGSTDKVQVDYVYILTFSEVTDFDVDTTGIGAIDWSKSGDAIETKELLGSISTDEKTYHVVEKEDSYVTGNWIIATRWVEQVEDVSAVYNWSADVTAEELGRNPSIVGTSNFYLARAPISNADGSGLGSWSDTSFAFGGTFASYEEEEWSDTAYPSEPGKFMLNYTTGEIKLYVDGSSDDVVVSDVTATYMYREEYSLVDLETNADDGELEENEFKLSSTRNIGKPKPVDSDILEVYYTYSKYPSEALETQPTLPTHLVVDMANGTNGSGVVTITGTAAWILSAEEVTVGDPSLIIEIAGALDSSGQQRSGFLGKVVRVYNQTQDVTYNISTYYLNNTTYDDNALTPSEAGYGYGGGSLTLENDQFMLDSTLNSTPSRNDVIEVDYIWVTEGSTEAIEYTINAMLLTENLFWYVTSVAYTNFRNENVPATVAIYSLNEPWTLSQSHLSDGGEGTTYYVTYGYTAPKVGEQITVVFTYNSLMGEVQELINESRVATQDVVVKAATKVELDVTAAIVLLDNYVEATVKADVESAVTDLLTADTLAGSLQPSDVTYVISAVDGVDSVTLSKFAESSGIGTNNISMDSNEYYAPGTIAITVS